MKLVDSTLAVSVAGIPSARRGPFRFGLDVHQVVEDAPRPVVQFAHHHAAELEILDDVAEVLIYFDWVLSENADIAVDPGHPEIGRDRQGPFMLRRRLGYGRRRLDIGGTCGSRQNKSRQKCNGPAQARERFHADRSPRRFAPSVMVQNGLGSHTGWREQAMLLLKLLPAASLSGAVLHQSIYASWRQRRLACAAVARQLAHACPAVPGRHQKNRPGLVWRIAPCLKPDGAKPTRARLGYRGGRSISAFCGLGTRRRNTMDMAASNNINSNPTVAAAAMLLTKAVLATAATSCPAKWVELPNAPRSSPRDWFAAIANSGGRPAGRLAPM